MRIGRRMRPSVALYKRVLHTISCGLAAGVCFSDEVVIARMKKRPAHALRGRSLTKRPRGAAKANDEKRAAPDASFGSSSSTKRLRFRSTEAALPLLDQELLQAVRPSA